MESHEAQSALNDVRRWREQARAEFVRYGLSWPYLGVGTLLVFMAFASFDLPNPWGGAVLLPSLLLAAGTAAVYRRRAPVRMPLTHRDAFYGAAGGLALVGLFRLLSGLADSGGVPSPHVTASAVVCGAGVLLAIRWRAAAVARGPRAGGGIEPR